MRIVARNAAGGPTGSVSRTIVTLSSKDARAELHFHASRAMRLYQSAQFRMRMRRSTSPCGLNLD